MFCQTSCFWETDELAEFISFRILTVSSETLCCSCFQFKQSYLDSTQRTVAETWRDACPCITISCITLRTLVQGHWLWCRFKNAQNRTIQERGKWYERVSRSETLSMWRYISDIDHDDYDFWYDYEYLWILMLTSLIELIPCRIVWQSCLRSAPVVLTEGAIGHLWMCGCLAL